MFTTHSSPRKRARSERPHVRVLLVESHHLVRRGLRDLLEGEPDIQVVAVAATAQEALDQARIIPADVAVVGVRLSDGDGVQLSGKLKAAQKRLRMVMLAPTGDRSAILRAISIGLHGFLQLDVEEEMILSAVRSVGRGERLFDPRIAETLLEGRNPAPLLDRMRFLTGQERLVLELLAQGLPNRDIAERAHLAEKTVRNYVSRVLLKLGLRNRTEAALYATQHDIHAQGA